MVCKNCGKEVKEGTKFCTDCGAPVQPEPQATYSRPNYQQPPQQQYQQYDQSYQHYNPYNQPGQADNFAPVTSVGKYVLWIILSTMFPAGFIILIVFALDKTDKNRSNFAKAMLITQVCATVMSIIVLIVLAVLGVSVSDDIAGEFANDLTLMM